MYFAYLRETFILMWKVLASFFWKRTLLAKLLLAQAQVVFLVRCLMDKRFFLIPENDMAALCDKIHILYKDATLRTQLGQQGRQRVLDIANWDNVGTAIFDLMRVITF